MGRGGMESVTICAERVTFTSLVWDIFINELPALEDYLKEIIVD